jgi:ketosteroid isomerase-like protein
MSDILRVLDRGYTLIWREGRIEDALRNLGDDFEWVVPNHPEGEVRRGADSVIEFFRDWLEPWEDFDLDWELQEGQGQQALAVIEMRGRGRESGVPAEMRFAQVWTFRDGRAIRMVMYNDVDEARRAVGAAGP